MLVLIPVVFAGLVSVSVKWQRQQLQAGRDRTRSDHHAAVRRPTARRLNSMEADPEGRTAGSLPQYGPGAWRAPESSSEASLPGACYANALANGFALDDNDVIARNPLVRALSGVVRSFAHSYWPRRRVAPVSTGRWRFPRLLSIGRCRTARRSGSTR